MDAVLSGRVKLLAHPFHFLTPSTHRCYGCHSFSFATHVQTPPTIVNCSKKTLDTAFWLPADQHLGNSFDSLLAPIQSDIYQNKSPKLINVINQVPSSRTNLRRHSRVCARRSCVSCDLRVSYSCSACVLLTSCGRPVFRACLAFAGVLSCVCLACVCVCARGWENIGSKVTTTTPPTNSKQQVLFLKSHTSHRPVQMGANANFHSEES